MRTTLFLLAIIVLFVVPSFAHTIVLKSGHSVVGTIVSENDQEIKVDVGVGTPLTYYRDEIAKITDEPPTQKAPDVLSPEEKANQLENKGLVLIDKNQMEAGLDLMRQAIALDPSATRELNYGTVLFGNGVSVYKGGDVKAGQKILSEAEKHIQSAIAKFKQLPTDAIQSPTLIAQAYYLLGEIANHAFDDTLKAKEYYQKAVDVFDHEPAKAALAALNESKI